MKNDMLNLLWLLKNDETQLRISMDLIEYASQSSSYTLHSFAHSKGMNLGDIEALAKLNIRGLPDACAIALDLIAIRQNAVDSFVSYCWQNKNGEYWQEVQLMNKLSRKWFITSLNRLS